MPAAIKELDGTKVTLRGFLNPLFRSAGLREFLAVPNHSYCCSGVQAGANTQVHVQLRRSALALPDTIEPLEIHGTFRVLDTRIGGCLVSIFRLEEASVRIVSP